MFNYKSFLFSPISLYLIYTTVYFIITPLFIYFNTNLEIYFKVFIISTVSNLLIILGYLIKFVFIFHFKPKFIINVNSFVNISFLFFIVFIIYTVVSFGNIPLVGILFGQGDPNSLRGELFKGRDGYEVALLYLSAFFYYIFIPISIVLAFHFKLSVRYLFLIFALLFSISTLQKALILNILLPLFVYFLIKKKISYKTLTIILIVIFLYFLVMIQITGHGDQSTNNEVINYKIYFSSKYLPNGALDYFIWRLFSVPIYTAADTIYVFENWINNNHIMGGTSTLISKLFDIQKVELEKLVFEYQFGGYNKLANANTYFAVDMYANFSWIGVILISFFIGVFIKSMEQTNDIAIYSICYLFIYQIVNGSFFGIMLSSGFIYILVHVLFFKFKLKDCYAR
ncbi:O-antigen polymerase [Aliarcobacter cibarius]|uniref:O-antigen polymerase n=1 Tax=Aliarcobacter cibarius TaxID=255507 RepID=UPI001244BA39|nr:O-antigen polymerase [Aliarcobacter cibarius]